MPMASVCQMSQVWHVPMASVCQMSQVWHVPMASVHQMSQVWHVPMASVHQMSQVWHVPMASVRQMSCHVMLKLPLSSCLCHLTLLFSHLSSRDKLNLICDVEVCVGQFIFRFYYTPTRSRDIFTVCSHF